MMFIALSLCTTNSPVDPKMAILLCVYFACEAKDDDDFCRWMILMMMMMMLMIK